MVVALDQRGPLELGIEIETAEGAVFRLDADALKATNVPTGISFGTQRGDGFATASFTLSREIFKSFPDLNLLDTVRIVGRQDDIAYEGRVQSFPRSNNPQTITVNCVGWMTYLKSRPMAALIIDRRLGGWGDSSISRKAKLLEGGVSLASVSTSSGFQASGSDKAALIFAYGTFSTGIVEGNEMCFYAGGEEIGSVWAEEHRLAGAESSEFAIYLTVSSDDVLTSYDQAKYTFKDIPLANVQATAGRKYAMITVFYEGAFSGAGNNTLAFEQPRVIGTHGLTARGSQGEEGYFVSDVIQYLLSTYAPKIEWRGEENQFLLQQATWHDSPSTAYDAIQQLNNLILWETNVWEDRKFYFEPADLTKADWQLRTDDPGVTVQFQGDSIENFANGVVVTYSDFFGHTYTLYPDTHAELQDESDNDAATRHGEDLWIAYTIPWQCLEAEAVQLGRAYLAENNRPRRPGTFTVEGYIKDAAGHSQQAWKVRSSQTLSVMDDPYEGEPRLITATSYDAESSTLSITVDAPPMKLDAIVARQQLALAARNLSS